jgi:hypothetical protein
VPRHSAQQPLGTVRASTPMSRHGQAKYQKPMRRKLTTVSSSTNVYHQSSAPEPPECGEWLVESVTNDTTDIFVEFCYDHRKWG